MSIDYINFDNTKFLISSHVSSFGYAQKLLKASLLKNNIPEENIYTVVADTKSNKIENNIILTDHNSYDHTAIIEIAKRNIYSKYWFIIHDTCECGNQFYNLLKNKIIVKDYVAMSEMAWLNMGLFSNNFIQDNTKISLPINTLYNRVWWFSLIFEG
jgi:hypothetical protein